MQPINQVDFIEVLNGMVAIKKTTLTPETIDLWWACMADWSIEDFKAAAVHLLKTCTFMPTPKDFEDLRKAGRETPGEAWLEARQYIMWGLHGYTLSPKCPPQIARVVRMIGGPNVIGMCDEDKLHFLERRFTEHYETLQDSEDVRESVPAIAFGGDDDRPRIAGTFKRIGQLLP